MTYFRFLKVYNQLVIRCCRGAMNNKELGLWCRRGLLAYVYNGVSE